MAETKNFWDPDLVATCATAIAVVLIAYGGWAWDFFMSHVVHKKISSSHK